MRKAIPWLFTALFLICLWQIIALYIGNAELFPPVGKLFRQIGELFLSAHFYLSVGATFLRGVTGMLLSFMAAIVTTSLCHRYKILYSFFRPLLTVMRSVPVISFILLALIFLHPESIPLLIGFLTMYPLLTENMIKGSQALDMSLDRLSRQFRLTLSNHLTQIIYPQLKPYLFSGLSSAMGFGWRAIIMGEVLSQCDWGIGSEMKKAQVFIDIPQLLAWTAIAVLLSFLTDRFIRWINRFRLPVSWKTEKTKLSRAVPVEVCNITFAYDKQPVISRFNAVFTPCKITGISAPSGQGKTTLLNLINGELTPDQGEIRVDRQLPIANIFQQPVLLNHLTVEENLFLAIASTTTKAIAREKVKHILQQVMLGEYAGRYPEELSTGQQQRVAIARALLFPAPLLLMDEPFKGLEKELTRHIIHYIQQLHQEKKQVIIFTSHQPDELELLANEIINLHYSRNGCKIADTGCTGTDYKFAPASGGAE